MDRAASSSVIPPGDTIPAMINGFRGVLAAGLACALAGCGGMKAPATTPPAPASSSAAAKSQPAKAPTTPPGVNKADVEFMAGMIPHHAQAVVMAGWAASHGARE